MLLRDALGAVHVPARGGARIVSLVPSLTELCFDLGLGSQVVGRTKFCIHPDAGVACVPRVGGTKNVAIDRVRELRPTHLLVNVDENTKAQVDELAAFVPHVVVTHPKRLEDNLELYRLLGGIFGRPLEAERLSARFAQARAELVKDVRGLPSRRVLHLIWRDPWMTVGPDTYIARMLAAIGWSTWPEASAERYPLVDWSEARLAGVHRVLLASEPFPFSAKHASEVGVLLPGVPAELVDGELLSWYGSRAIAGLGYLSQLARFSG